MFKNPRDMSSIRYFSRQIDPTNSKNIIDIFMKATKKPFSYLLFDLTQETPDELRLRSNIFFENNEPRKTYVQRPK